LIPDLTLIMSNTSRTSGLGTQLTGVYEILEEHVQLKCRHSCSTSMWQAETACSHWSWNTRLRLLRRC